MKKLSALLLSALLLLGAFAAFTGCGGGEDNPPDITTDKIDYNGTININLPIKDYPFEDIALKAVARAYMDKHPETDVKVEGQTSSTYKDWLDSQFAGGSSVTDADIVQTLLISNAYLTSKMVDYSSYLVKPNPYNQNKSWKDTMEEEAYPLSTDRSGIYTLNFTTNMSFFFYNKSLWKQAGLTNADGTDKAPKTWDELLEFCAQIESNTQEKVPFAVGGATYTTGAMSWLLNIYGDQYYRGIADDIHAVAGDYCYDPDIDADWTLDITDKNNDAPSNYTANMLRFYAALMDNEITPKDAKYQAMITNLKKLIPVYCQDNFISNNYYQAEELFWGGNAAMVYNTTDFFNTYKQIFAQRPDAEKFEIGFFPAPPMTGTGDAKPDADTVRSVGGAVGWYGVVKKDKKQNDLVMDFMMFWGSKEGPGHLQSEPQRAGCIYQRQLSRERRGYARRDLSRKGIRIPRTLPQQSRGAVLRKPREHERLFLSDVRSAVQKRIQRRHHRGEIRRTTHQGFPERYSHLLHADGLEIGCLSDARKGSQTVKGTFHKN